MSLEQLWAGWRHAYVASAAAERPGEDGECVFCRIVASGAPGPDNGVVWRDELTVCVLNAYPYTSGHVLVAPARHVPSLADLTASESSGLWETTRAAVAALGSAYRPDGVNLGANLGRAAGAGIPGHLHLHALPRWSGDTNFMTAVSAVRVIPESLPDSWRLLHDAWPSG